MMMCLIYSCALQSVQAAADGFTIHVEGKGGHAAAPHKGIDPLVAGANILLALQSIVARNLDH
jgi:metal-dependent amidase/aminoacylase/carboxypeptidase family protein